MIKPVAAWHCEFAWLFHDGTYASSSLLFGLILAAPCRFVLAENVRFGLCCGVMCGVDAALVEVGDAPPLAEGSSVEL